MPASTDMCLRLRNNTAGPLFFAFIGPHGMTLGANTSVDVDPNLLNTVGPGYYSTRKWKAYLAALDANLVEIIHTPRVVLYDTTLYTTKRVALTAGVIALVDPSWGAYSGPG